MFNGILERARSSFELWYGTESAATNASSRSEHDTSIPFRDMVVVRHEALSLVHQTFVNVIGTRHSRMIRKQRSVNSSQRDRNAGKESLVITDGPVDGLPSIGEKTRDIDP